jgi:hypothetical protein
MARLKKRVQLQSREGGWRCDFREVSGHRNFLLRARFTPPLVHAKSPTGRAVPRRRRASARMGGAGWWCFDLRGSRRAHRLQKREPTARDRARIQSYSPHAPSVVRSWVAPRGSRFNGTALIPRRSPGQLTPFTASPRIEESLSPQMKNLPPNSWVKHGTSAVEVSGHRNFLAGELLVDGCHGLPESMWVLHRSAPRSVSA